MLLLKSGKGSNVSVIFLLWLVTLSLSAMLARASKTHYEVLGVARSAEQAEIRKAFRQRAKKFHPDVYAQRSEQIQEKANRAFVKLNEAHDVLSDPQKRREYDHELKYGSQGGSPMGRSGGWSSGGQRHHGGPGFYTMHTRNGRTYYTFHQQRGRPYRPGWGQTTSTNQGILQLILSMLLGGLSLLLLSYMGTRSDDDEESSEEEGRWEGAT